MRRRLIAWLLLGLLCFVGALYFLRPGHLRRAQEKTAASTVSASGLSQPAPAPIQLLSQLTRATNGNSRFAYRLSNTTKTVGQLGRTPTAILLENALIDTALPGPLPAIPESLRSKGEPGTYIVQSRSDLDNRFRDQLKAAGAVIIAYVPNNAYLVRVSAAGAEQLRSGGAQAVLPYEPYYKLKSSLLGTAVRQEQLPVNSALNVLLFADSSEATVSSLRELGAEVVGQANSPFGPVVTIKPPQRALAAIAGLAGVQEIELAHRRVFANDLSRETIGVSLDSVTPDNYLGLSGSNIMVNVNDSGVDMTHPDLAPRVFVGSNDVVSGTDPAGHGTHVAGIIASSGGMSLTVTGAQGSILPPVDFQFRGKAPNSKIFSINVDLGLGSLGTDAFLQETAAKTNAFISNNSWHFFGDFGYGLGAASYDAAVRDALPGVTGSQPIVYVFPGGNGGAMNEWDDGLNDGGQGGQPDLIQSPATAKNVITVGAIEQFRNITNGVTLNCATAGTNTTCDTNKEWQVTTDSSDQVLRFSSRGNVSIGFEGDFGRFKPDLVAPGSAVVSTRAQDWDESAYYNPTNHHTEFFADIVLNTNDFFVNPLFIPDNALVATIQVFSSTDLPIFVNQDGPPSPTNNFLFVRTNIVQMPPDHALSPVGVDWWYGILNDTTQQITISVFTDITTTNDHGDFLQVLSNLNNTLGPFYRYESGSSMAAAEVSGTLALMEEFFEQRIGRTASPALLKAMLINGARSVGDLYDLQVNSGINYQGWGLINLPNSLPGVLTNINSSAQSSMFVFDQGATNALATGERHTRFFSLSTAAQALPLRATLVWTDPPGNPTVGVKLVNDLDLVVTNLETGEVFLGNDIIGGNDFNLAWDTNSTPNLDFINNVENVYIQAQPRLGTNFSVTVVGHRVNVNAVTAEPARVAQDYALVVSSGDGQIANGLTMTDSPLAGTNLPNVTYLTNEFAASPDTSGGLLLGQRVGANSQVQGLDTTPLPGGLPGIITVGVTNQWHFYVLSNDLNFTNVAFVTFLPPNLSIPRVGVNENNVENATRIEADIELYVSQDSGLTNLTPGALAGADKSLGRGGTEFIVYSNAPPGAVYYVGVKSEDQEASEYGFLGIFSELPFSTQDSQGNVYVRGLPVPANIPDGTPTKPGAAMVFGIAAQQVTVRRVIVTNTISHELAGDLLGNLSHNHKFVVLNNHTCATDPGTGLCFTNFTYIYEDNGENNVPGSRPSDGPGSLKTFVGEEGLGLWLLTEVDNAPTHTGRVESAFFKLEPQILTNDTQVTIQPNTFFFDSIDVPVEATNLTVCVGLDPSSQGPVELYVRRGDFPSRTVYDKKLIITTPGGCLTVTPSDLPPISAGRYYIGVFNGTGVPQIIRLLVFYDLDIAGVVPIKVNGVAPLPILDDAVTYSTAFVTNNQVISSVEVGLRVEHPRVSDCVFTLISPSGTRILLSENRGALTPSGMGGGALITNVFPTTASGDFNAVTNTIRAGQNQGTLIIDYDFFDVPDTMHVYYDGNLIFNSGLVGGAGRFNIDFGPGAATDLFIVMNEGGNSATNTLWQYTATVVSGTFDYLVFTENTNTAKVPIKFAIPPFTPAGSGGSTVISTFDSAAAGDYTNPAAVDGWSLVGTNPVRIVNSPPDADSPPQFLSLFHGHIQRSLPTTAGQSYVLTYASRNATNCVNYPDFNSINGLNLVGNASVVGGALRLTPSATAQIGDAWLKDKQQVGAGFDTSFQIRFTNPDSFPGTPIGADGITFSIQNVGPTDNSAVMGGTANYVSVLFNTFLNWPGCSDYTVCDVSSNSVAVLVNSGYRQQVDLNPLGIFLKDGNPHQAHITSDGNFINVTLDGVDVLTNVPVAGLKPGTDNCGEAWVGFNASCGWAWENQDVLNWSFCTHAPAATAQVLLDGAVVSTIAGTASWQPRSISFKAATNGTLLDVSAAPCSSGMLLDTFGLSEGGGGLFYMPEETLKTLVGENAFGQWKLEIVDNRAGATNPPPQLVAWQLRFTFENTFPRPVNLTFGNPGTNTIAPGSIGYFVVDVPIWASFATNILLSASTNVNMLYGFPTPPTNGDFVLLANSTGGVGVPILSTNTTPQLQPGNRYFIGIQNNNPIPVTVAVQVDFDITPLTNRVPLDATMPTNNLPRYFSYDVSSNATAVTFQLLNLTGDLSLVASRGPTVPSVGAYDYASFNPGTDDEEIIIFTNSNPVPLGPGRWYLGVFNSDVMPVDYRILVTEYTNQFPPIITLFNAIPYANTNAGGLITNDYYRFVVSTNAVRAQFEINNPSADMTLVARKGLPPPDLSSFDLISANPGTSDELITIFGNSTPVPLTPGEWFLTAVNLSGAPVTYSIKATEFTVPGTNIVITGFVLTSNSFCITWTSVPGIHYFVQGLTDLNSTNWVIISPTITAAGFSTTYCIPLPSIYHFFRVGEGLAPALPAPALALTVTPTPSGYLLQWTAATNLQFNVQWASTIPLVWNTFTNVITSTNGNFSFLDDGSQSGGFGASRFYRLRQLP